MRLLVITRSPWVRDNSIGNTLCDFFSDFNGAEIYSLCLKEAPRVCEIPLKNFYISEYQIIKKLLHMDFIGKITEENADKVSAIAEDKIYNKAKRIHSIIPSIIRELLWEFGTWKNEKLDSFLAEALPDVIFFPVFPCAYAHKVLKYVHEKTQAKVVIFHADDSYSINVFSISPLQCFYRLCIRNWVRKTVKISDVQYVISDVQKSDYDKSFHIQHKVLTKFSDFENRPATKTLYEKPLQAVFTGNINYNRWKSLSIIARTFEKLNENGTRIQLKIYTASPINNRIRTSLNRGESSFLIGKVSAEEIPIIQTKADILVHVEAFDKKNRFLVRQSFSTKLVDYMKRGRAILSVGPLEVASIKHLIDTNSAIVTDNETTLYETLNHLLENPNELNRFAERSFECGKQFHNKSKMLPMLYNDIMNLTEDSAHLL